MLVQIFCPLTFCFLPSSLRFFKIQILHDFCQECLTNPGKRVSKLSPKWITFRCCRGSPQSAKCFWAWSFCLWMSSVYPIFGWQFWKIKRWKIKRPPAHLLVALQHLSSSALGPTWRSMVMNIKTISIWGAVKIYYNCLVCFWRVIVFWGGHIVLQGFAVFSAILHVHKS